MKVTTEGCLFGALIMPKAIPKKILDIGTGTGLLSLMLSQKYLEVKVDAVEIDKEAYVQAQENFKNSPWVSRLKIENIAIQKYTSERKYDLIISNPPFFKGSQLGGSNAENVAKHDNSLTQQELIKCLDRLLSNDGEFWILYPEYEATLFHELAKELSFYRTLKIEIKNQRVGKVFRVVQAFSRRPHLECEKTLIIRERNKYTSDFTDLLKEYYLEF